MSKRKDQRVDEQNDQDSEPSLNAPGDAGPTGVTAEGGRGEPSDEASEDQDAEPRGNAPGDAGPTGSSGG